MLNLTVIGGSGFIGSRLIDCLKEAGDVTCKNVDIRQSPWFPEMTTIGDVRSQEDMDRELEGTDIVVLLAAQHRDDVHPVSLYYDTNVRGVETTLRAMERNGVRRIVFFSSVAVYGINKQNPDESHPKDPLSHYGKSKWLAEQVLEKWHKANPDRNVNIIRPTVTFGERNRGNVYNLLHQIADGRFLMVGKGNNRKSMAYVGNVVAFVKWMIEHQTEGYNVYNYIDKPDFTMNELVAHVEKVLNRHIPSTHYPYWLGMTGGYCFDALAFLTRKKLAVSSVRVKKFCATTEYDATKMQNCGFTPPYSLGEGLARTLEFEFVHPRTDDITFKTE